MIVRMRNVLVRQRFSSWIQCLAVDVVLQRPSMT
jgi:hypothetical protein